MAQLLIEHGADVNMGGSSLPTVLMIASKAGDEKMVQLLLDNGADIMQWAVMYAAHWQ